GGVADAARGAGDESDAGGEGWGHDHLCFRHARPCAGHPRLRLGFTDVDGRDKPGHDGSVQLQASLGAARRRPPILSVVGINLHALSKSEKDERDE
ncbi:hypothetical protein, partial [Bradyrhizobium sp.]|uniref:hypothetical protein n=1 Tax=Bradyrhizobium sp. TaxID=376 RepID=UPI0025C0EB27